MKRTSRRLRLGIAVILLLPFSTFAQQPQTNPEQISVITFVGEINNASIGQLLIIVNNQLRNGVHKIRLVISSGGGDPSAAFAAYNYLRNLPSVEISTFNIGNVDSAAVILYCAGQKPYTFPATRFLIHGNSLTIAGNLSMDVASMQGNMEVLKSLNQMTVQVIASTVKEDKQADIENAVVHGQIVLTADEATKWGLAQEIKSNFMEPGAVLVSVSAPPTTETKPPIQFTSTTPTI